MTVFQALSPPHAGSSEDWQAWAEGLPVSQAMGLTCVELKPGHAQVVLRDAGWPLNPNGAVHGGMVAAWADHCCGLVATRSLRPGQVPATATLSAEFLRPALPPLTFDARVDRSGQTLAFVAIDVMDASGKMCSKFIATMSIDGTSRFVDHAVSSA